MPKDYPKDSRQYEDEDEEGGEEESEEEEEEEEEEQEEWNELIPLNELDELEDGPSTHFVGGFSTCKKLSAAVAKAQYAQDRILVFPGTYTEAALDMTPNPDDKFPVGSEKDVIVLDEARLKGLVIEGVPFARATDPYRKEYNTTDKPLAVNSGPSSLKKSDMKERKALRTMLLQTDPAVGRRVGPWFTYYHAAAAANTTNQAGGTASASVSLLKGAGAALGAAAATTTMGSSVFGSVITPTAFDAERFPVISSRLILRTSDVHLATPGRQGSVPPLKKYAQEPDDEEEDEEREDLNGDNRVTEDAYAANEDENGSADDAGSSSQQKRKAQPALTLQGLCFPAGLTIEPLTSSALRHCVFGVPSLLSTNALSGDTVPRADSTLLLHPLAEATLSRSVIYGGVKHGVYAYPRSAVKLVSCLIDGPSLTLSMLNQATLGRSQRHAPSALAALEAKAYQRTVNEQLAMANASGTSAASVNASASRLLQQQLQGGANFVIPEVGQVACDVGVFCDDADLSLVDCMISNVKLGLLLHDGCKGATVLASDVRCVEKVGVYVYGVAGAARVHQCTLRACGRECLLVVGPTEAEVAAAEAQFRHENGIAKPLSPASQLKQNQKQGSDGEDEDEDEEEEVDEHGNVKSKHPVFAQHPNVRGCVITGGVRLQGQCRDGACVDNLVFSPVTSSAASAATSDSVAAAADLIQGPNYGVKKAYPLRGFLYSGMEGAPRKTAAAEDEI